MANLLHRVMVQDQLIAADGVSIFDIGSNPLSVILIALRPLNDNAALTGMARYRDVCGAINRVTVLHRGASVFSMSGLDAVALNYFRHGIVPMEANPDDADNERRCVVLPILLGRFAYDPRSCLPATARGELMLELDLDIADTGYDGLRLSIETIELMGVSPSEFERKVTTSQTFAATGDNDIFLPTGNIVRGMLLFGTTTFTGATPAPSWGRINTYLDGRQVGYASTDFEVAMTICQLLGRMPPGIDDHTHRVDATAAVTTEETSRSIEVAANHGQYCYLDYDPTRNDMFAINTADATQWFIRADAETANAVRVITVEKIVVSG